MIHITRRETFNAAHRLYCHEWDDEKNLQVFGKCSNPQWHGHNYTLFVTVRGYIDDTTGFVLNMKDLSDIIKTRVIEKLDHKNINLEVDFMKGKIPSAENVAKAIWEQLKQPIREHGGELYRVKLIETENNYVEYFGE